jgi:hypothetical protein
MNNHPHDLVQRQAAILSEIDDLDSEALSFLADPAAPKNSILEKSDKARRLLRGLIRSENVGRASFSVGRISTNSPTIIPALPGLFVIYLMPRSDGSFDRERVIKEPVVGWRIDAFEYAKPIIPGCQTIDRWAVLTPDGLVMTDEFSNIFGEAPLALKDWIRSEIEYLASEGLLIEFPTVCNRVFEYCGPLAKAVGLMMAGRREWVGSLEEMFESLCKFRENTSAKGWPSDPVSLQLALQHLKRKLAEADLFVGGSDDGRVVITRAPFD